MEDKHHFSLLSDNLNLMILSYLELSDYIKLSSVCSFLHRLIARNPCIYSRDALFLFFPKSIDFYCEFTDSAEFSTTYRAKLERIMRTPTRFWKNKLKLMKDLKKSWIRLISGINSLNKGKNSMELESFDAKFIVESLFEIIRNPAVPMPSLKRETVGTYCESSFQNLLVEQLYLGSGNMMENRLDAEISRFNDYLAENLPDFEAVLKANSKSQLLEARWYIYESLMDNMNFLSESENEDKMKTFSFTSEDDVMEDESSSSTQMKYLGCQFELFNQENVIMSIYNHLFLSFMNQTSIINQYLLQQDNPYDFINEYCTRWNIYVASMVNLEKFWKEYVNALNFAYESIFQDHPSFPKFSIWRMMAKIWHKCVYQRVEEPLAACFRKLLKVYRQKNMDSMITKKKILVKANKPQTVDDIPLPLYNSFNNKKNMKKDSSFRQLRFTSAQFGSHDFFSSDAENIGALLFNFLNSLVDLSINEVNVHYLGHSELKFDYPYKSCERNIRRLTSSYYQDHYEIFYQTPDLFLAFLEADCKQVSRIGNHKLKYQLEKIKIEAWLDFFKNWCLRQVERKSSDILLDLPYGFESRNKEVILEILRENQEELQTDSGLIKTGGLFQESQDTSKLSESCNPRMKDIKEEDEEISSMSNSKFDELPKIKKRDFSGETPLKSLELNPEMMEEIIKHKASCIYYAILEKFKGSDPCAIYTEKKARLECLNDEKLSIDLELEDINQSRKIPMDMGDATENFYNISRDVTKEILIKMVNNIEDGNSRFDEAKDNDDDLPLPKLGLKNYRSNNEFDRLGLKKEKSENC